MTVADMSSLVRIVSDLVSYAYNDLDSKRFIVKTAKISSFACITWDSNQDTLEGPVVVLIPGTLQGARTYLFVYTRKEFMYRGDLL